MAFHAKIKQSYKPRSGIALGGIGTGGIELRADGIFRNWHIFNNAPFGTGNPIQLAEDSMLFFVVRYQEEGSDPKMKVLQIEEGYEVAAIKSQPHYYIFPWLTGVDEIEYSASFPFVKMKFSAADMPFDIHLEAFSPFIPHDIKNSSLPGVIFNFTITSKTDKPVEIMLMASMRNAVGYDVEDKEYAGCVKTENDYSLFEMTCNGMDTKHSSYGSLAMASLSGQSTYYIGWEHLHPYYEVVLRSSKLPDIDDTAGRNTIDDKTGKAKATPRLFSTIAASKKIVKKESFHHTFILGWNFPNLYARESENKVEKRLEGSYYSNFFQNASSVVLYLKENLTYLSQNTRLFHKNFFDSSVDSLILDQINSHLNTFISSSWFTKDIHFGIMEGLTPLSSWGPLATMDVGMYGNVMVAALFPDLMKSSMLSHQQCQAQNGEVSHGIDYHFERTDLEADDVHSRLDMPSQYIIQALRHFFWTNDLQYLKDIWSSVKKALHYVLNERDHNHDSLPDMEGTMCSYDNFPMYGAASYVSSQWLSALSYVIVAAEALGYSDEVIKYKNIYETGRHVFEQKLWNGKYYRLYNDEDGKTQTKDEGCLTDQLIGLWSNHLIGCEKMFDPAHIQKALTSIMKMSFNPEYGLCNCRWPQDGFLHDVAENCWNDQANTCWSGVELAFASLLIYEGMLPKAMKIIKTVDMRYRKSGMYFDHIEYGGHYFRAMSAWSIVNAMLGLTICGNKFSFAPKISANPLKLFFSFGTGTAHYVHDSLTNSISINVHTGELILKELDFQINDLVIQDISILINDDQIPKNEYVYSIKEGTLNIIFHQENIIAKESAFMVVLN